MNTRDKFHAWLATQGYRGGLEPVTPEGTYPSSHIHHLWECWLAAIESVKEDHEEAIWQARVDASREAS
jgi:hypothetical protein